MKLIIVTALAFLLVGCSTVQTVQPPPVIVEQSPVEITGAESSYIAVISELSRRLDSLSYTQVKESVVVIEVPVHIPVRSKTKYDLDTTVVGGRVELTFSLLPKPVFKDIRVTPAIIELKEPLRFLPEKQTTVEPVSGIRPIPLWLLAGIISLVLSITVVVYIRKMRR